MRKIDYGQAAQVLANIGVLAGIIFLAFELRQNNELLDMQVRATTLDQRQSTMQLLVENPDILELLDKDQETLSEVELDRLRLLGIRVLVSMENDYFEAKLGRQDIDELRNLYRVLFHRKRLNYALPIGWSVFKAAANPEFADWFENEIVNFE